MGFLQPVNTVKTIINNNRLRLSCVGVGTFLLVACEGVDEESFSLKHGSGGETEASSNNCTICRATSVCTYRS